MTTDAKYLKYHCPHCKAKVGEPCNMRRGNRLAHAARQPTPQRILQEMRDNWVPCQHCGAGPGQQHTCSP